jgi:hypothetical protein
MYGMFVPTLPRRWLRAALGLFFAAYCGVVRPAATGFVIASELASSGFGAASISGPRRAASVRAADDGSARRPQFAVRFVRRHRRRGVVAVVSSASAAVVPSVRAPSRRVSCAVPACRAPDVPQYPPSFLS